MYPLLFIQVTSNPTVECIFQEWRLEDTVQLLKRVEDAQRKQKEAEEKLLETIGNKYILHVAVWVLGAVSHVHVIVFLMVFSVWDMYRTRAVLSLAL